MLSRVHFQPSLAKKRRKPTVAIGEREKRGLAEKEVREKGVVGGGKWSTEKLFPVEEVRIGPTEVRNDRLKEVLLRDKPEVIRLRPKHFFLLVFTRVEKKVYPFQVTNGFCFVPFGRDYRPRTNIHSRLTPLFTIRCFSVYPRHPSPPYFLLFFSTQPRRYPFYISPWTS